MWLMCERRLCTVAQARCGTARLRGYEASSPFFSPCRSYGTGAPLHARRSALHVSIGVSAGPLTIGTRRGSSLTRARRSGGAAAAGSSRTHVKVPARATPRRAKSAGQRRADAPTTATAAATSRPSAKAATEREDLLDDADEEDASGATADGDAWQRESHREPGVDEGDFSEDAVAAQELDHSEAPLRGGRAKRKKAAEAEADDEETDDRVLPVDAVAQDALESKFLVDAQPELAAEYVAAGKANKDAVTALKIDSGAVVTWRCRKCQQNWKSAVFLRCILKNGCPTCEAQKHPSIAAVRPDLVPLWHPHLNDPLDAPDELTADSRKYVFWVCGACRGDFRARVKDRVSDKAPCPWCPALGAAGRDGGAASKAERQALLEQEWHPLKNGDLRLDALQSGTLPQQQTKVWWLCSHCSHTWTASVAARLSTHKRSKGRACPNCRGASAQGDDPSSSTVSI